MGTVKFTGDREDKDRWHHALYELLIATKNLGSALASVQYERAKNELSKARNLLNQAADLADKLGY
ncbi:MAG: hypothetical protein AABX59_00825 [Nanoarchaeota archaeon]